MAAAPRSPKLQADAVLDVHNPSRVHTLSVRELTCPVWMQADVSGDGVFKPEEYYLGTLLTSHTDDAPLVFKSGGRKRHAQTTRLVEVRARPGWQRSHHHHPTEHPSLDTYMCDGASASENNTWTGASWWRAERAGQRYNGGELVQRPPRVPQCQLPLPAGVHHPHLERGAGTQAV